LLGALIHLAQKQHSSHGDRCFAAAGPKLWNSFPAHRRQTDINFVQFRRLLKTFLFGCWDRGALWLSAKLRLLSVLTYFYLRFLPIFKCQLNIVFHA